MTSAPPTAQGQTVPERRSHSNAVDASARLPSPTGPPRYRWWPALGDLAFKGSQTLTWATPGTHLHVGLVHSALHCSDAGRPRVPARLLLPHPSQRTRVLHMCALVRSLAARRSQGLALAGGWRPGGLRRRELTSWVHPASRRAAAVHVELIKRAAREPCPPPLTRHLVVAGQREHGGGHRRARVRGVRAQRVGDEAVGAAKQEHGMA